MITTVDVVVGVDIGVSAGRCIDVVVVICVRAGAVYRGSRCGVIGVIIGVGAGDRGRAVRCVIGIYQSLRIIGLCRGCSREQEKSCDSRSYCNSHRVRSRV